MRLRFRGPPLGFKLLLLSAALLIVPYFSYRQVIEVETLLVQGQSQAQILTARGIATLLNGREDLIAELPATLTGAALFVQPLPGPIVLDGDDRDWSTLRQHARAFGHAGNAKAGGGFEVLLGERAGYLHGLVAVRDDALVATSEMATEGGDRLDLRYADLDGIEQRVALVPAGGSVVACRLGASTDSAECGAVEPRVQAAIRRSADGYLIEFRLPIAMIGAQRQLGLAISDIDQPGGEASSITAPSGAPDARFDLIVLRSPEVLNIVQGLVYAGAQVQVLDAGRRVRADVGSYRGLGTWSAPPAATAFDRYLDFLQPLSRGIVDALPRDAAGPPAKDADAIADHVIETSLRGEPIASRRRLPDGAEIITAAHPIVSRERVIGVVVLQQNTNEILALQRQALERIIALSLLSMLIVVVALLLFSVRLAWRIRSLRREASNAIDQHGRLRTDRLRAQIHAGDEIGDLARSVSNVLARLHQHTRFLETIPRTLRHEINNPLNVVSTSLQNLEQQNADGEASPYLDAAKRGVLRIGGIVQHLADAASLEESLEAEELEPLDLRALVESYVDNCRLVHRDVRFVLQGAAQTALVIGADYRLEQLLDKIVDNAIDFHHPGTPIVIQLDVERDHVELTVANRGPTLPDALGENVFDSMVSQRSHGDQRVHFGLGLYVVRMIALHHGGSTTATNLPDRSGVAVSVRLPRAPVVRPRRRLLPGAANGDGRT